jgi:predicted phage terminase large subunit-like protein
MTEFEHIFKVPELGLHCLDAVEAEDSLMHYMRLMWPVLEPGTDLVEGQVLDVMAEHLEAVTKGKIKRLLINVPPGFSKSLMTDVLWPSWTWGPRGLPHKRFVSWSYAEDLTLRDNKKAKRLIRSEEYQRYWSDRFQLTSLGEKNFSNDHEGFKMVSGVHGQGTGHRGDHLVLDDPHSVAEAESEAKREAALFFFSETLPTRFNSKNSSLVIIMQRVHEDDISGHILRNELGFEHLCLPMEYEHDHPWPSSTSLGFKDWRTEEGELLWPERFDREQVEETKKILRSWGGEYAVAGQFQQRPVPRGGGMFKRKHLKVVQTAPEEGLECRGWDLASTRKGRGARTAGVKILRHPQYGYFVTDVVCDRWSPGEVKQNMLAAAERDGKKCWQSIPQDPGQSGKDQVQILANMLSGFRVHTSLESGSKEDRAEPWAAQAEVGNVHILDRPWTKDLINELTSFPNAKVKDQVDGGSRAFAFLAKKRKNKAGAAPVVI